MPERALALLRALPLGVLLLCALATEPLTLMLLALSATALHELGHLVALAAAGASGLRLVPGAFGLRIYHDGRRLLSHRAEALAALAGPLANLATAILTLLLVRAGAAGEVALCFASVSVILASVNLLPISSFDGGRALVSLLSLFFSPDTVCRTVSAVSVAVTGAGTLFGLFLMLGGGGGLYLFTVSFSLLLGEILSSG